MSEEELIKYYFYKGLSYSEILLYLGKHNIHFSEVTLKRRLKNYGLRRYKFPFHVAHVRERVRNLLDGHVSSCGYRYVWQLLRLEGIFVPREFVRILLKELDPVGVDLRRAHRLSRRLYHSCGPNFAWHCDGYDKLKPYGFPIHGCIDGWSRKILWLHVTRSNNCPVQVAKLFLNCTMEMGGCPAKLVTDLGTENGTMATIQTFFRDNANAHIYVASPRNQRIESWWASLRKCWSNFWMRFFKDLQEQGLFDNTSQLQKECLWFAFSPLLHCELQRVKVQWNSHYVRKSRFDTVSGKPDVLYTFPENHGGVQCLQTLPRDKLDEVVSGLPNRYPFSGECEVYQQYFRYAQAWCLPYQQDTRQGCLDVYRRLLAMAAGV